MKEGTVFVEISPPSPWPAAEQILIGPRMPLGGADNWIRIFARPDGRLKIELSEMAVGTVVLTTCPIEFENAGYFRLGVAWNDAGADAVAFAGGQCVASNSIATVPIPQATIKLKSADELTELPKEEGEVRIIPGDTGYSI